MTLSDLCIRRPVFATVLSLLVVLIGLVSYTRLSVREYPKIDEPVVTVETTYKGASPEIMESRVTKPLEDSLAGIEGIEVLSSISRQENSQITVRFKLERNPDSAAADVRDRVSRVRGKLPQDVDDPIISKVEADANPIIWIAFSSDRLSALEVTDIANRLVKPRLQTLPGAADVRVFGERKYSMRIWLDRGRLAAYGLTTQDVESALTQQNVEIPAGRIESSKREFTVVSKTDLTQPQQFEQIVVKQPSADNGYPVRISDIGRVEEAAADERSIVRYKGKAAVALGVIKQATANPLELSSAVRAQLPRLINDLPPGLQAEVAYDSSVFIDRSIGAVKETILEAIALVAAIIFLFLRNWRAMIIPLVTIPVSLVGAFALMLIFNFSINTLTLLAMVLAIGLVVDDAIVVLENVYRHMEMGKSRLQAALDGSREIAFAVIAMTLTLAAVYAPIAFMTGRTGKLFIEFALTLAGAVLVSGFVALTLSPMMCSLLLKHEQSHGRLYTWIEQALDGLNRGYARLLAWTLAHRVVVMAVFGLAAASAVFLFSMLKQELSPTEDRGTIVGIFVGPEGATTGYMDRYAQQLEGIFAKTADVDRYFVVVGNPVVNQGISFVRMRDWDERTRSQMDVVKELQPKMFGVPGVLAFPVNPPSLGQSPRERPVNFVILTSGSYEELDQFTQKLLAAVAKNPGFQGVDTDLKLSKPELGIEVNRDKAAQLGVHVDTIGNTLQTMLGGRQVTRYKKDSEQYDVIVQLSQDERTRPQDIDDMYVRTTAGDIVPLSNLVGVNEHVAPRELNHFGQRRALTLTANLAPGYAMGDALNFLDKTSREILPSGYSVDYNGQSREFRQSSSSLAVTFGLALAFIYLVLSAQFESWRNPLIIMLTVPLSMTGALAALLLTGNTLNVYSQIGLVTLIGLITKHGILIVEFSTQLREQGMAMMDAVQHACVQRLRPILMTTGAMVLGSLPLALGSGAGAESRHQIGWVIVGGLMLGTLLTLFVVPTVYTLLATRNVRTQEELQARTPSSAPSEHA